MTKKKSVSKKKVAKGAKKSTRKAAPKSKSKKTKDIKTVSQSVVNFPVSIPTDHTIINKLRTIRDKVFASFGLGLQ